VNKKRHRSTTLRKNWERERTQRRKKYQRKRASWAEFWNSLSHKSQIATEQHLQRRREVRHRTATTAEHSSLLGVFQDWLHWGTGAFFLILSYIIGSALYHKFAHEIEGGILQQPMTYCFVGGGLLWAVISFLKICQRHFLYLYVFGHEFTHAFFIWLFLGRISDLAITPEGGYVQTRSSNFLIALSPYFVPFLGICVVGLFSLLQLWITIPYANLIIYSIVGFTWSFHIMWTQDIISKGQEDLKECGTFMSLSVIIFFNLLLMSVMICMATDSWLDLFSFTINAGDTIWNWCNALLTPRS